MIITICGSCTFAKEMGEAMEFLKSKGFEVFAPEPLVTEEWYADNHGREKLLEDKPMFTKNQFKKIENSDAVLIFNKEKKGIAGYFGSNTLMELSVAFYLNKKIYFLNEITEKHPHYEEVIGLDSITLDGDLSKIA